VICGTNLRLTHFVRQGVLFSPFKTGELDIFTDFESFGKEGIRNSVRHYFGITLPDATCSRWSGRARLGVEVLIEQIFNVVDSFKFKGDLYTDVVAEEQEWYDKAVKQWENGVSLLLDEFGTQVVNATGNHSMTLAELFKKIHRAIWASNKGEVCIVSEAELLVDAGIMFLRGDDYQLIDKVVVLAVCNYFDHQHWRTDISKDHILQHYLHEMQQAIAHGTCASYDVSWEFFTARLFMLQLQDSNSRLFRELISLDPTMAHYTFKGRFCVSSREGLKTYDYIEKVMETSEYDETVYLADNFSGGDLFLVFIRKLNAPTTLPPKRFGICQAKALTAATQPGDDTRAIATTQIVYTGKRELKYNNAVNKRVSTTAFAGDRKQMEQVLEKYPKLGAWSISFFTVAGKLSESFLTIGGKLFEKSGRSAVNGHRLKLQLGLYDSDSYLALDLWVAARDLLARIFNLAGERNSSIAQKLLRICMLRCE
jgi:hypothetical protein